MSMSIEQIKKNLEKFLLNAEIFEWNDRIIDIHSVGSAISLSLTRDNCAELLGLKSIISGNTIEFIFSYEYDTREEVLNLLYDNLLSIHSWDKTEILALFLHLELNGYGRCFYNGSHLEPIDKTPHSNFMDNSSYIYNSGCMLRGEFKSCRNIILSLK